MIRVILKSLFDSITNFLLLIAILSCSIIYFFGETTIGLQTALNIVTTVVPGKFHYENAHGKLFSNFSFDNFSYQKEGTQVHLSHAALNWNIHALFHYHFVINALQINDLHVNLTSSKKPAQASYKNSDLLFLKNITAHSITLNNFKLTENTVPVIAIKTLHLQKIYEQIAFTSEMLNGDFDGSIHLSWQPYFHWEANISGNQLNPGLLWKDWPGQIKFALISEGGMTPQDEDIHLNLKTLTGTLRAQAIHGNLQATYSGNKLQIENSSVNFADAELQLSGNMDKSWNVAWHLNLPKVSLFIPDATGQLNAEGKITGERAHPMITARISGSSLNYYDDKINKITIDSNINLQADHDSIIHLSATDVKIQGNAFNKIDLGAKENYSLSKNSILSHLAIDIANKHYIDASFTIPKNISAQNYKITPIAATLSVNFPDFTLLKEYFPSQIKNPAGVLRGLLNFSGTLTEPRVNGTINLSDGRVSIPSLNITLTKINLSINGNENKKINYLGSAQSDKGTLQIKGATDLTQKDFPTDASIQGQNLQVINTSEYKIIASPNLTLHYLNEKLSLQGDVTIPEARITPKDYSQTVTLPDEVVFVNAPHPIKVASAPTYLPTMQVTLTLGDKIFVKYENLQTNLIGKLTIATSDNRYTTATGELIAKNGKYNAYGQLLKIQEGNLIYTGNLLTNPGLNIKAVRTINTISTTPSVSSSLPNPTAANTSAANYAYVEKQKVTVGVKITGNLMKPIISLYSDPSNLSQSNILSYLVLGIPETQAPTTSKQALMNAASLLSMGSGGSTSKLAEVTKKLQTSLGLTELNVQSVQHFDPNSGGVVGTTSLVVGKKIADKLYINYSIGLFTPVSILDLRYQFNKHWAIQSETSTLDKGADILYSIERD